MTSPKKLIAFGCNPRDIFLGVRPVEHNETFFRVDMVRTALNEEQAKPTFLKTMVIEWALWLAAAAVVCIILY